MEVRKHFIGQLDYDDEPCGLPSMWDLSGFPVTQPIREYDCSTEAVAWAFKTEEGVEITSPLCQLVDVYDRLVYPGYWSGCCD